MKWTAIVPLKPPGQRKTRLAPILSAQERDRLSDLMFTHVTTLLTRHPRILRVIVLAAERPSGWTGPFIHDRGRGLNAELQSARAAVGAVPLLVLHADLPLLRAADVATLLRAPPALAPDRHGTGTNALALPPRCTLRFRFGRGSFRRHAVQMPAAHFVRRAGLAFDLDTDADLQKIRKVFFFEKKKQKTFAPFS